MWLNRLSSKKDRRKFLRGTLQAVILLVAVYFIIKALYSFREYQAYDLSLGGNTDKGFIAISYFGVDRTASETLISTNNLEEHLKALKNSGYVTISQQDVLDYYEKRKTLPDKSLFLIFEDGRRDTAVFAQKILEKYNFKATMLSYADKFEKKDTKFLMPKELLRLKESTFWELGTNGYRLEYINAFDRYKNYLGELNTLEFAMVAPYLDRNYNHYLMDYIRDDYGIPKENYHEMKERISYDYIKLKDIYTKQLGSLPEMYILMHSNTGQYGTNDKVSAINEEWIKKLFKINFNREGYALNERNHSIYDLTRVQPQAYWPVNHLLMRIWDDTKQEVAFTEGDTVRAKDWERIEGQPEFKDDSITLTSLPKGKGILRLKNSNDFHDLNLSVFLEGNKLGSQKIYIGTDEAINNYTFIQMKNNILTIGEKNDGKEKLLFSLDLDIHDGKRIPSKDENKKESELEALKMRMKYTNSADEASELAKEIQEKMDTKVPTVQMGAAAYRDPIELKEKGGRFVEASLEKNQLTVSIDGKKVVNNLKLSNTAKGSVCLVSERYEDGYSQRNLTDDIYDGVFRSLLITTNENEILFDSRLKGKDKVVYTINTAWEAIVNWFIRTL